jgi:signal transduction histidine kinase
VNGKVEISVADQGMGISREDLRHVFERFYRGEAATGAGTRGTGIGLAVVEEIVKAHGGTVCAESEPGRGSTFTIVLPRDESV